MKKLFYLMLCLCISLVGCGSKEMKESGSVQNLLVPSDVKQTHEYKDSVYCDVNSPNTIYLGNTTITVPCTVQEVLDKGFHLIKDEYRTYPDVVEPEMGSYAYFKPDGENSFLERWECELIICNNTSNILPIEQCTVSEVRIERPRYIEEKDKEVKLDGDIYMIGQPCSTEKVIAIGEDYNNILRVAVEENVIRRLELRANVEYPDDVIRFTQFADNAQEVENFINGWHLQEPKSVSYETVHIDANWKDYVYLDGVKYDYGIKVRDIPYYGFDEEFCTFADVPMNVGDAKVLSVANVLVGDDEIGEYIADSGDTTDLAFLLHVREDYDYFGDSIFSGIYLKSPYGTEASTLKGTDKIGIGSTYNDVIRVLGEPDEYFVNDDTRKGFEYRIDDYTKLDITVNSPAMDDGFSDNTKEPLVTHLGVNTKYAYIEIE